MCCLGRLACFCAIHVLSAGAVGFEITRRRSYDAPVAVPTSAKAPRPSCSRSFPLPPDISATSFFFGFSDGCLTFYADLSEAKAMHLIEAGFSVVGNGIMLAEMMTRQARIIRHHDFRFLHVVALDVVHAQLPQHCHGVRVLDAFRDGFDAQLA